MVAIRNTFGRSLGNRIHIEKVYQECGLWGQAVQMQIPDLLFTICVTLNMLT